MPMNQGQSALPPVQGQQALLTIRGADCRPQTQRAAHNQAQHRLLPLPTLKPLLYSSSMIKPRSYNPYCWWLPTNRRGRLGPRGSGRFSVPLSTGAVRALQASKMTLQTSFHSQWAAHNQQHRLQDQGEGRAATMLGELEGSAGIETDQVA